MDPLFELACHEGNYALTDVLARWFRRAVRTRYGPGQLNPPSSGAVRETAPAVGQPVFAERRMGHHYRDGKRMALCGRMAYPALFTKVQIRPPKGVIGAGMGLGHRRLQAEPGLSSRPGGA